MGKILIIGGASLDILHFAGQTARTPGGAGLYTALAAQRCGAAVTIFAPRPEPVPGPLAAVPQLVEWVGPAVTVDQLPRFEYGHYDGETIVHDAFFGAELELSPQLLPSDLSRYDLVHIIPLGDPTRQLAFLQESRRRGARRLSAGTFLQGIHTAPALYRQIMAATELFFMNQEEAETMFGAERPWTAPGKLLVVTRGREGAEIYQGHFRTPLPAVATDALDPTGAGDTFCGGMLAYLARGEHPLMAARRAMPLAAEMVTEPGPAALLTAEPAPDMPADSRVQLNTAQLTRVAAQIAALPEVRPFDFTGPDFPPVGDAQALDFFFTATLQQFSFWHSKDNRYAIPLIAPMAGSPRKGSSFLFGAYRRALVQQPELLTPTAHAALSPAAFSQLLADDNGETVMPALGLHFAVARGYGQDLLALGLTPEKILTRARGSHNPLGSFLELLDHVGGYKEDPLRKKSTLLALILQQRPEQFLPHSPEETVPPVIDYHLMRSCLRVGLLDLHDPQLYAELTARRIIDPVAEWAVRWAAYRAIAELVTLSGKTMGAVDWFFFNARKRCPEMSEPDCPNCLLEPACAQRKELFQPVMRTSFY